MRFAERPRNSLSYIFPFLHFFFLLLYFALSAHVTGNISCCLPWSFVAKTSLKFISLRVTSWIDGGKSERAPSKLNVINSVEEEKEEKGKKNLNRMNGWWRKNVKITYCITGWKPLAQWLNPSFVSFYSKQDVLSSVLKWETFPLNISHFKWMHTFFFFWRRRNEIDRIFHAKKASSSLTRRHLSSLELLHCVIVKCGYTS